MRFSVLGSGSTGNGIYVEHDDAAVLIDAGLSPKEIDKRLFAVGVVGHSKLAAVLITHGHGDHTSHAKTLYDKWHVPVHWLSSDHVVCGDRQQIHARPFPVPHDGDEACGWILQPRTVSSSRLPWPKLGVVLDAGCFTVTMNTMLAQATALVLGCDYDEEIIKGNTTYPKHTLNRITSDTGHMSNQKVGAWIRSGRADCARAIVLAHISPANNAYTTALLTVMQAVEDRHNETQLAKPAVEVSYPHQPTPFLNV